jgi:glucokinase
MNYSNDKRIVMTLDAGGTNLVFSAVRGNEQIIEEVTFPTNGDDLDKCLTTIINGFNHVKNILPERPAAISFAFPGPADYPNGIIGDLPNLPAFRGGVALGPMLQDRFGLHVFINNDGDLYTYGEAMAGFLPYINNQLSKADNPKRYKNLLGITLGTGFGAGIVNNGNLFFGDNSNSGEIWLLRDKLNPSMNVEEHASIRGVRRIYAREAGTEFINTPVPKDIYEIARGKQEGNKQAAIKAFMEMAEVTGDAISNAITLIDGLVVIGGGLAGAKDIFLPYLINEMNSSFTSPEGVKFQRLSSKVYNLENEDDFLKFIKGTIKKISVYGTDKEIKYDPDMRIGVGISKIGTSKAIAIGAYTFALRKMDTQFPPINHVG